MEQIILAICYERLVLRKNNTCYKYGEKSPKKPPRCILSTVILISTIIEAK